MTAIDRRPDSPRGYSGPVVPHRGSRTVRTGGEGPEPSPTAWHQGLPGPQLPGFVSGAVLLAGIWLMIAPSAWNYGGTGGGFDARWNDLAVGTVLTALGLARLSRRIPLAVATLLGATAGLWLIAAPFALTYGYGTDSTRATLNDLSIGLLVILVSALGHSHGRMVLAGRL